jgi:hypothetical protein
MVRYVTVCIDVDLAKPEVGCLGLRALVNTTTILG